MTSHPPSRPRRWLAPTLIAAGLLGLISAAVLLWPHSTNEPAPRRVIQEITLITPPPPPPPEPEEKIMEEEEVVQPTDDPQVQKDVDTPSDQPDDQPSETSEASGLDKAADVGSDSFHLASGGGGGLFGRGGGGGGDGGWGAFVETHIRRALQRDPRTRTAQGYVRVAVEIDPSGRITGAKLRSSTGDDKLDKAIREVLSGLTPLSRGRPPKIEGVTFATINMKRPAG
jgi:periplasmic protein TonB